MSPSEDKEDCHLCGEKKLLDPEEISLESYRKLIEEGDALIRENLTQPALNLYESSVFYLRWDPDLHWRIANCYKSMKRWSDAANSFREVINIDAERKGAWFELGVCLSMLNCLHSARICFQVEISQSGAEKAKTNLAYVNSKNVRKKKNSNYKRKKK